MSFDCGKRVYSILNVLSQSLWNRAVSFDVKFTTRCESGSQSLWNRAVSFDTFIHGREWQMDGCLNPFGTGQCLSTDGAVQSVAGFNPSQSLWNRAVSFDGLIANNRGGNYVSIPLEQGSVFRLLVQSI